MVVSCVRALSRVLGATALLVAVAAPALSAQTFVGQIVDAESRLPLGSVSVQLLDSTGTMRMAATTDATGRFTFHPGEPGTYVIRADAAGYTSFTSEPLGLAELQTRTVEIHMPSVVTQLEPVVVTGERAPHSIGLQRFEEHRQRGLGYFMERPDIEEKAPNTFTDVMWDIPGVQVVRLEEVRRPLNAPPVRPGTYTLRMRGNLDCAPSLYVDGMLFGNVDYLADGGINDLIYAPDLEAVEVYRGASEVPPDMNTGAPGCGVIAVWTRRDRSDDQRADKLLSAGVGLTVPLDRGVLQVVSRAGPWDRYRFTMRFRLGIYETSGTLGPETPPPPGVEPGRVLRSARTAPAPAVEAHCLPPRRRRRHVLRSPRCGCGQPRAHQPARGRGWRTGSGVPHPAWLPATVGRAGGDVGVRVRGRLGRGRPVTPVRPRVR